MDQGSGGCSPELKRTTKNLILDLIKLYRIRQMIEPDCSRLGFSEGSPDVRQVRTLMFRCVLVMGLFLSMFFLLPKNAHSVNFSINPVRIFLDSQSKTNVMKIMNQSDEELSLQIRSYSWSHDINGENIYEPTKEIIFFPKIFSIGKGEEKLIRIGTLLQQGGQEKTYRLFIEEIPAPTPEKAAAVRMIMKVGTPVFISPIQPDSEGELASAEVRRGDVHLNLINRGNVHFIVNSISLEGQDKSGKEIYRSETGGWYIHGGHAKEYVIGIPEEQCHKIHTLNVDISTDKNLSFHEELNVTKEMCAP